MDGLLVRDSILTLGRRASQGRALAVLSKAKQVPRELFFGTLNVVWYADTLVLSNDPD